MALRKDLDRLEDEAKGNFDMLPMNRDVENGSIRLHSNYASPNVRAGVTIPKDEIGSYRGCVAAEAIVEGELLFASKAFAYATTDNANQMHSSIDLAAKTVSDEAQIAVFNKVVALLHRRPHLGHEVYKLIGNCVYPEHTNMETIHLFRIREILRCNAFSCNSGNADMESDLKKALRANGISDDLSPSQKSNGSGLWIQESFLNHSCCPNCTWFQIGDHIFVHSTRPIQKGEEFCVAYSSFESSSAIDAKFKDWGGSGDGFQCACERCTLFRKNGRKLAILEDQVQAAFNRAAELVSVQGTRMAAAANKVMSESRRLAIIKELRQEHIPIPSSAFALCKLEVMQGAVLTNRDDRHGALACYQRAADAFYAARGGTYWYAKELWRVVGAAMGCGNSTLALKTLHGIRGLYCFRWRMILKGSAVAEADFVLLTNVYAGPWWKDHGDPFVATTLSRMASEAWRVHGDAAGQKKKSSSNKKNRGGKKKR